jgi:hypothetical protein
LEYDLGYAIKVKVFENSLKHFGKKSPSKMFL